MNVRKREKGSVKAVKGAVNQASTAPDRAKGIKNAVGAQPAKHVCVMGGVGMTGQGH